MEKYDYKKQDKGIYLPKERPMLLSVPAFTFAVLDGQGDPNGPVFAEQTAALYSFSYGVKMSPKSGCSAEGYYDYTVFPLEGVWDLIDPDKSVQDKSNFRYSLMIRQPEFVTEEVFCEFVQRVQQKKPNPYLAQLRRVVSLEGECCQLLHVGSYDSEPASFARMDEFCRQQGRRRSAPTHREIYLSDPRKTAVDKLKTVLRYQVQETLIKQ